MSRAELVRLLRMRPRTPERDATIQRLDAYDGDEVAQLRASGDYDLATRWAAGEWARGAP